MTNTELQSALSTMQHRLNELENLTEILADVCGAAESLIGTTWNGQGQTDAAAWLRRKLKAAYRAGIQPTDYSPKAVDLSNQAEGM